MPLVLFLVAASLLGCMPSGAQCHRPAGGALGSAGIGLDHAAAPPVSPAALISSPLPPSGSSDIYLSRKMGQSQSKLPDQAVTEKLAERLRALQLEHEKGYLMVER